MLAKLRPSVFAICLLITSSAIAQKHTNKYSNQDIASRMGIQIPELIHTQKSNTPSSKTYDYFYYDWSQQNATWQFAANIQYMYYDTLLSNITSFDENKNIFFITDFMYGDDIIISTISSLNNSNIIEYQSRTVFFLDTSNRYTDIIYYRYVPAINDWIRESRNSYQYNQQGNLELSRVYAYINNDWEVTDGIDYYYTFNNQGLVEEITEKKYNPNTTSYDNFIRKNYRYTNQKISEFWTESFDTIAVQWQSGNKYFMEYSTNSDVPNRIDSYSPSSIGYQVEYRLDSLIPLKWTSIEAWTAIEEVFLLAYSFDAIRYDSDANNQFIPVEKKKSYYTDANGSNRSDFFKYENNQWEKVASSSSEFDQHKNIVSIVSVDVLANSTDELKFINTYGLFDELIEKVQQIKEHNSSVYTNQYRELINITISSTSDKKQSQFSIYPNPSDGKFYIKTLTNTLESSFEKEEFKINIYDVMGQLIFEHHFDLNNQSIDLSPFANGIYFAKINDETFRLVKY